MRKILLAVLLLLLAGTAASCRKACDEAWNQDVERCKKECTEYGASFGRLTPITGFCNGECWCRQGAESGQGSKPIRIW